jgi:hypothetical protein
MRGVSPIRSHRPPANKANFTFPSLAAVLKSLAAVLKSLAGLRNSLAALLKPF